MATYIIDPLQCECGLPALYDLIATSLYDKTFDHYDCRKVCIGASVYDAVERYYINDGATAGEVAMAFLMYGPKPSLEGYEVEVEEGWCYDD